jgi:hypothetical protein
MTPRIFATDVLRGTCVLDANVLHQFVPLLLKLAGNSPFSSCGPPLLFHTLTSVVRDDCLTHDLLSGLE